MTRIHRTRQSGSAEIGISRRAIAHGALGGGIVSLIMAGAPGDTHAQATPVGEAGADTGMAPLRYVLRGPEVGIVFTPPTAGIAARLEYRDADGSLSFTGDQLDLARSHSLGPVASVLLKAAPDAYVRYLTLLVPEVNPEQGQADVRIHTLAILTDHLTSIAGPRLVEGALQIYDVVTLEGVAEFAPA